MHKFILLSILVMVFSVSAADLRVVENGRPVVGIECTSAPAAMCDAEKTVREETNGKRLSAAEAMRDASEIIRKYVRLTTGAQLADTKAGPRIILKIEKGKMDIEGFRFAFPSPDVMEIIGGGPYGLRFAALDFCERFLGVRFLFPGPLGEYIPKLTSVSVPARAFQDAPKFKSRLLTGGNYHETRRLYQEWYPFQRGVFPYRCQVSHYFYKMFDSRKYGKTHPEFYPLINGKRMIPPPGRGVHWQPCLSNPAVVSEAAKIICDAFAADPELRSYSLGMTDGDGFCECAECRNFYPQPDVRNANGSPDRSRYMLEFYNRVAAKVTEKYPEATLSFLAYNHCSDAPKNMGMHSALVPVITYDRHNWIDPERYRRDLDRHQGWKNIAKGDVFCWYDYYYNNRYLLPRINFHHIARILRTGYAQGVRHYFAEYFPLGGGSLGNENIWCDGPLAYLSYKLLWNPESDVDAILDDWYRAAVGAQAAPYLRKYFEELENFWTTQAQHTGWFAKYSRTYLVMTVNTYLYALDPQMLDRCEEYLNEVCKRADHKERAEYLREGFLGRKRQILYWLNNQAVNLYEDAEFKNAWMKEKFDGDNSAWQRWTYRPNKCIAGFVPTGGRGDNGGSLCFEFIPDGNGAGFEKKYPVSQAKNQKISVWYRCENTDPNVCAWVYAEWLDNEGNSISQSVYSAEALGANKANWTQLSFKIAAPSQVPAKLLIRLSGNGQKGQMFFDDLCISSD